MKLGFIQTDPNDPKTVKIVNRNTGEELEDITEYNLSENATDMAQFLTVRVVIRKIYGDSKSLRELGE